MKKNKEEIISSNLTSEELKNEVNEYLKKLNEISTQQNAFDQIKKILEILIILKVQIMKFLLKY